MNDTLEFTIPDGYELDKEKSNDGKLVYRKKQERYVPKEGDLVSYLGIDIVSPTETVASHVIKLYGREFPIIINVGSGAGFSLTPMIRVGDIIENLHPATTEETEIFTRIMSENGYEYDPVKKEVRKKRWRAEHGEPYLYVSECGTVYEDREFNTWFDCFRHKSGNYFRLSESKEAEEVAAKFKEILNNRK
jgi:hypothetical protein